MLKSLFKFVLCALCLSFFTACDFQQDSDDNLKKLTLAYLLSQKQAEKSNPGDSPVTPENPDTPVNPIPEKQKAAYEQEPIITEFSAEGGDQCVNLKFAVSSTFDYKLILVDGPDGELKDSSGNVKTPNVSQSGEKFELKKDATSYKFEGLENSTVKNYSKAPIYTYTLILQDADGKELERRQVQSTPAPAEFEYDTNDDGSTVTQDVWMTIIPVDNPEHNLAKGYKGTYSNACVAQIKNSYGVYQCPQLYNNTATVSRLVADGTYLQSENFVALKKQLKLESTEEIEWFSLYRDSFHLVLVGQIVKPAVEKAGYTEVTSYETSTALALKDETKAFRLGTKIYTKGYYEEGDGGEAVYEISNRAKYTFGSIKTATGQWCNIVPQNNYMNLLALGAGRCFQVTWEKYPEWRAYKAAKKEAENNKTELDSKWDSFKINDDGARIIEANKILVEHRKNESDLITLYIPRGNYRINTTLGIGIPNYIMKGDTVPRHITMDDIPAFESTYAEGDESGSSATGGTVLYTDNGGYGTLNIWGPSCNTVIEGITLESREIDSKRTFWYTGKDADGNYTGINYHGNGSNEPTQADQQWFSRQVCITQCSNVEIRNCEFIITSHVRDKCVYPANLDAVADQYDYGGAYGEYLDSDEGYYKYQNNLYVEKCDLHTDKQFTTLSFYSDWKNVKVDNCLLYNMSGVFRGASVGFLDFYGGQCENATVNNCTLFHNCHDEQVGVFTPSYTSGCYKAGEYVNGVYFTNNRVYVLRDKHVDKMKKRVMVFTIGYDDTPSISNVYIRGNYIHSRDMDAKLFTFGGFPWDDRHDVVVENNTIDLRNGTGFAMFETRQYVVIRNNIINLSTDKGLSGSIGGSIFDTTGSSEKSPQEAQFLNNTLNVYCNFTGALTYNGKGLNYGIVKGNTVNIWGNQTGANPQYCLINGMSEVKDNTFNVNGRINRIYYNICKMRSDITIDGNTLNMNYKDTDSDYNKGGKYYNSGKDGFNFAYLGMSVPDGENYKVYLRNNRINAPKCTARNKHFIYLKNKNLDITATGNRLQKFKWLRYVNADVKLNYSGNYSENGKPLNKEDWYFDKYIDDTPAGVY